MNYEVKINYKYREGDYVKCTQLSPENPENLIVGEVYEVRGAGMYDGCVVYSVTDKAGNLYHTMDVFEKVGEREEGAKLRLEEEKEDAVNHPKHYQYGGFEVIQIIDEVVSELSNPKDGYYIGNALKYIMRHNEKNGAEDIRKAIWYLSRMVHDPTDSPASRPLTKKQIGYIAGLTETLGYDRYKLPEFLSPHYNYKELTEAEATIVIDKLLAIREDRKPQKK